MKKVTPALRQDIIRLAMQGFTRAYIATELGLTPNQVSAVLAHRTMGTYGRVDEATKDTVAAKIPLPQTGRRILLGTEAQTARDVWWQVDPTVDTPNPHLLIIGDSGSGKTYAVACLLADIAREGISSIVFDYGQGFAKGAIDPDFDRLASPTYVNVATNGININPLQILPTDVHGPVTVAQRVADTFARVYRKIGIQQHSLLRKIILGALEDAGIDPDNEGTWTKAPPPFKELRDALEQAATDSEPRRRTLVASIASHISTIFFYNTFRPTGTKLQWADMIAGRKVFVLNLRGLERSLEEVVTEFLLWNLIGYAESIGPGPLRCFVVIDEAHKMTFGPGAPTDRLLREGRKFGLAAILASQQPEDFSTVAFANTSTKLVFQVTDERNRISRHLYRKGGTHSLQHISEVISKLKRGYSYAITQNTGAVVHIASFAERKERWRKFQEGRRENGFLEADCEVQPEGRRIRDHRPTIDRRVHRAWRYRA